MAAIRIENLTKRYKDVTAVDDLTLTIEEGETFALLGVNGAGKTTTVKMLCGLTKPTSGEAYLYDRSVVKELNEIKEFIALSMQETAVARNLSVEENLSLFAEIYGLVMADGMMMARATTKTAAPAITPFLWAMTKRPNLLFLNRPVLSLILRSVILHPVGIGLVRDGVDIDCTACVGGDVFATDDAGV